jgi:hypothetical protein
MVQLAGSALAEREHEISQLVMAAGLYLCDTSDNETSSIWYRAKC